MNLIIKRLRAINLAVHSNSLLPLANDSRPTLSISVVFFFLLFTTKVIAHPPHLFTRTENKNYNKRILEKSNMKITMRM